MLNGRPPWERALEVQGELTTHLSLPVWQRMMENWITHRHQKYGWGATAPSAYAIEHLREHLRDVEPIYVTDEMQELTYNAMEDFDATEPCIPEEFGFIPAGLAVLDEQFFTIDQNGGQLGWRVISWRFRPGVPITEAKMGPLAPSGPTEVELDEAGKVTGHVDCVEVFLWSHVDDDDDYSKDPDFVAARESMRLLGARWSPAHATTVPLHLFHDTSGAMSNEGDPKATWVEFLRVLLRLMEQRIVLRTRMKPHRAVRRAAERAGVTEIKDVLVVELRRPRERGMAWPEAEGDTMHYSHRFMVKGHWRNQPYPSLGPGVTRQIRIGDYIKGPPDAPLILKKRVWVWDR